MFCLQTTAKTNSAGKKENAENAEAEVQLFILLKWRLILCRSQFAYKSNMADDLVIFRSWHVLPVFSMH